MFNKKILMKKVCIVLFLNIFLLLFLSSIGSANIEYQNLEVEINISENYSTYYIEWKIYVDVNYYYPAGSEFKIYLPKDSEILSVRDDFENVEFKIYNSSLIFYNRRNIYHGDNYRFYIAIKQNYNPIYYNKSFYFKSFYSYIPLKINLPIWARDIKILSGKNYTITSNSIYTREPIFISFGGKDIEEENLTINLENIKIEIHKKYLEKLLPILEKIENYYWKKFEEIFSNSTEKIYFNLVTDENRDWICYYHKNSISCSVEILFYDEDYITKTILHELTHHFIYHNIGNGLHPWIEEGIAEKISREFCNFTKDERKINKIIKDCYNVLSHDFWNAWICKKFNNCNVITHYFNDSCILDYGLDDLRYIFSLEIVNKTLTLEDIKEISKFFREHNIYILASSENKEAVSIFLVYLFGKNYEELKNYGLNFENFTKAKEVYKSYNDAKEKIKKYYDTLPKNLFIDVNYKIDRALNNIFNGYFDDAEREIKQSKEMAENIKIIAEKIKENIENIEKELASCYYSTSYSLIQMANESYNKGKLNKSIEYIEEAIKEKKMVEKRINNIIEKTKHLKSSFVNIIFSDRVRIIEDALRSCEIEKAEKNLKEIEDKFEIIILFAVFSILSVILILFYFHFRNK